MGGALKDVGRAEVNHRAYSIPLLDLKILDPSMLGLTPQLCGVEHRSALNPHGDESTKFESSENTPG